MKLKLPKLRTKAQKKFDKLYAKGVRTLKCPKCKREVKGKWLTKVLQHTGHFEYNKLGKRVLVKCGYFDPEVYREQDGVLYSIK